MWFFRRKKFIESTTAKREKQVKDAHVCTIQSIEESKATNRKLEELLEKNNTSQYNFFSDNTSMLVYTKIKR